MPAMARSGSMVETNLLPRKRARTESQEPSSAASKPRLDAGKPEANGLPSAEVARAEIRAVLDLWEKVHLSADGECDGDVLQEEMQHLTAQSVAGRNAFVNCLEGFTQQVRSYARCAAWLDRWTPKPWAFDASMHAAGLSSGPSPF